MRLISLPSSSISLLIVWVLILSKICPAKPIANCQQFQHEVLIEHPILAEKEVSLSLAKQKLEALNKSVILPKFELQLGMGPAPGLRSSFDTSYGASLTTGDTIVFLEKGQDFDFRKWGPFYGLELNAVQPLNYHRFKAGQNARVHEIKVTEAEFQKEKINISQEAQEIYYQYQFALRMQKILSEANRDLNKAEKQLDKLIDEEDPSVSQNDLFKIKAGKYVLTKGLGEAEVGLKRAAQGLRFYLGRSDTLPIELEDSVLARRTEQMPSLDTLHAIAQHNHPDLKRLRNGLIARQEQMEVAKGEIGPDIFLFGNFKYSKAWSEDREVGSKDPFSQDPLNELTGVGGIGLKLKLNFWDRYENYKRSRIELSQLKRTDAYASQGILIYVNEAYWEYEQAAKNADEAETSLRAAESWLKSSAMDYDIDPSKAKGMLDPYKTAVEARRNYYEAVMNYNIAWAKVIQSVGWTLDDFLGNVKLSP